MNINDCDTYMINLEKDVGRKLNSKPVLDLFNCVIWKAHDGNIITFDNNKESIKWTDVIKGTEAAKYTKIQLLNHFIKHSKQKYLLIFEDDCYLHSDLIGNNNKIELFNTKLNNFLLNNKVSLLYLGVSRHIKPKATNISECYFESFSDYFQNDIKKCSGAYGVIINRDVIKLILARAVNSTLYGKPFDLTCLGFISDQNPNTTYVMHPPLVVPDITQSNIRESTKQELFWKKLQVDKNKYNLCTIGTICVWIDTVTNIIDFYKKLNSVKPAVSVVFFTDKLCDELLFIDKLKKCTNDIYNSKNIMNYLQHKKQIVRINTSDFIRYKCGELLINKFID